jgi:hypothetical protein
MSFANFFGIRIFGIRASGFVRGLFTGLFTVRRRNRRPVWSLSPG